MFQTFFGLMVSLQIITNTNLSEANPTSARNAIGPPQVNQQIISAPNKKHHGHVQV